MQTEEKENLNATETLPPLKLGLLIETATRQWWVTYIEQLVNLSKLSIEAVWSFDSVTSQSAAQIFSLSPAKIYCGVSTGTKKLTHTLEDLLSLSSVDALIIDISPPRHLTILNLLLQFPQFNKHIYSTSLPTLKSQELMTLLKQPVFSKKVKSNYLIWGIGDSLRYEAVTASMAGLLPDIGTLVGASLQGSQLPCLCINLTNKEDLLLGVTCNYVGLLRTILGHFHTACCINNKTSTCQTLVGWLTFTNNVQCIIKLSSSLRPFFEFRVWGTTGYVAMRWLADKQFFEIQRYLKHFEHPAFLHASGLGSSLEDWLYVVRRHNELKTQITLPVDQIADVTVASAMLTSEGSVIRYKDSQLKRL